MEPARGESCPSAQRRVPPHPGRISSLARIINSSIALQLTPTARGGKRESPGSIPSRRVWKRQPNWLVADWLRLMEPAPGESCPSGQHRGPAAPGGGKFPCPDHKFFHVSTINSNNSGTTTGIPRVDTTPQGVETPTELAGCLLADAHGANAARVASRDNVEVTPHPERIGSHPRVRNPSISLQLQLPGDENKDSPGRYRRVWKPQPHWLVADWLRLMEPARGKSCHYGQRRRPAVLREDQVLSSDDKSFHFLYNSYNPGTKKEIVRVDTAPQGVEAPTARAGC